VDGCKREFLAVWRACAGCPRHPVLLNDLWEFDPTKAQWAWMGGNKPCANVEDSGWEGILWSSGCVRGRIHTLEFNNRHPPRPTRGVTCGFLAGSGSWFLRRSVAR
jgi:hypothetical protein